MARKPIGYWEKRSTQLLKLSEKKTEKVINKLIVAYNEANKYIAEEINDILSRYAKNGLLDKLEAQKLLNTTETKEFYNKLLKNINNVTDKSIKKQLLSEYNAPAYSYRISRLEALRRNINIEIKELGIREETITKQHYEDIIHNTYNNSIYNIQLGTGYGFDFARMDTQAVERLLNTRWINGNYSTSIWKNSKLLVDELNKQLLVGAIAGKPITAIAKDIATTMNIGLYNATRLVRTETNFFHNEVEALSYEESQIDKYRYIATLDMRTCKSCGVLDNKVFLLKNRISGKNYPPLHPNDRCTTVPYITDIELQKMKRAARDSEGNAIEIPVDMNYEEWKAKYIEMTENEKGAIKEYSNSKSYFLNEKLRNQMALNSTEKELVKNIDNGLSKLPNYDKITYRQIGFDLQGQEGYNNFMEGHKENKYIKYKQYISSSKNYNGYEVDNKLKVEITIEGKTGKDIRGFAGIKDENEVLFERDVLFEIEKVLDNKIWLKEV